MSRARTCGRRALRRLSIAVLASLAVLVAAELGLRRWHPLARGWYVWPPGLELSFEAAPGILAGIEDPARFRVGRLGLRGDELPPEADWRIVAVGGSTTECLYLDRDEAWPGLLQRLLGERHPERRVWVGNAGRSGHDARQHVYQVERLARDVPGLDLLVVLVGCNDLYLRLGQGEGHDPRWHENPRACARELHWAFSLQPVGADPALSWHRDLALRRLASWAGRRLRAGEPLPSADEARPYLRWREHRASASEIRESLPDLEAALGEYRRNLGVMIAHAREAGVQLVFATQPSLYRPDLPDPLAATLWSGGVGPFQERPGCPYYSIEALAEGMARYNRVLEDVCREQGVACIDLAAALPRDGRFFYDDVHFTEQGARGAAEALAEGLLPLAPPR